MEKVESKPAPTKPVINFYNVAPLIATGSNNKDSFTYSSARKLETGALVRISFRKSQISGVVIGTSQKPKFKTLSISEVLPYQIPPQLLKLAQWISQYYAAPMGQVLQTMLPKNLAAKSRRTEAEATEKPAQRVKINPNAAQKKVLNEIWGSPKRSFLLHGVTGSGKTQIYIELIKKALLEGKSAVVLVPEISLTPQILHFFKQQLGSQIFVTHSGLSSARRREIWKRVYESKKPLVIIGPRSALFMPLKNLGYVIIDEAHETTYKQEQAPRYHAAMAAARLCQLSGAKLIMGSATPTANDWFLGSRGKLTLLDLPEPVFKRKLNIQLVDLKQVRSGIKSGSFISKELLNQLQKTLSAGKQSIIFINRRGSARLLLCGTCGWVANCPRCHVPLTFHADRGKLLCHWCNFTSQPPARCPKDAGGCGNMDMRFIGAGTKRIEAELASLLPEARIARLDKDSFKPQTIKALFNDLKAGKIDILVGTQMVTKGLDLENMETIGIVLADSMLHLPDYTANERTFALLHQVAGRAGRRKDTAANVVIQTYSPNNPAIAAALKGNYHGFITRELAERKLLNYPPYTYLLKLSVARASQKSAQTAANKLMNQLVWQYVKSNKQNVKNRQSKIGNLKSKSSIELLGPAPAFRETHSGKYHWQIIVKAKNRDVLVEIAKNLPAGWTQDLDPVDLL